MLPTGAMHVVLRLGSEPLRLFEGDRLEDEATFGNAVVGGIRVRAYAKDIAQPTPCVGAMLEPGAALALFGVTADELAGSHTPLDALWGNDTERLCDQLASLPCLEQRLERFEDYLAKRLPRVRGVHPGVARVLAEPTYAIDRVHALAEHAGLGPRRFARVFRSSVGVSPKRWLRLRRFQRVIARAGDPIVDWADLAFALGYSDQPHLVREFREFSGITPSEYQRLAPEAPNHVPIEPTAGATGESTTSAR